MGKCCNKSTEDPSTNFDIAENEAATKIQARFRGNQVRKQSSDIKKPVQKNNPHIPDPVTASPVDSMP